MITEAFRHCLWSLYNLSLRQIIALDSTFTTIYLRFKLVISQPIKASVENRKEVFEYNSEHIITQTY
ncbi:hypothetical protein LOD99_1073 [Oopsacas minuta]|uniref:Uncharacterized protein n=1 Tax=Oopsacas minuta TaxID=111878 RepID=A0AAV7K272_9METZ|nr:hypothetical protein LOD99_1073 [Oopsacas minuta]